MTTPPLPRAASGRDPLSVARLCAREAATIVRSHLRSTGSSFKGHRDLVTEADLAVDQAVHRIVGREFPDHTVLSEETANDRWSEGWMWVCDPIDGTRNFAQGLPHFAFSIALCHGGEPVVALTTQPLLGWEFAAIAGSGTTFNGVPARASERKSLAESVLAIDLGYDSARGAQQLELAVAAWEGVQSIRVTGSAALGFAYLAAGLWDGYVHRQLKPWDSAAGLLLVREAGGVVTDFGGAPAGLREAGVVAAAAGIHSELLALAARADSRRA